jgi:hypothetical protein
MFDDGPEFHNDAPRWVRVIVYLILIALFCFCIYASITAR